MNLFKILGNGQSQADTRASSPEWEAGWGTQEAKDLCLEERQCLFDVTCSINEESSGGAWGSWLIHDIVGKSSQITR